MAKLVEGYVMGEDRTTAEGKYIMLDVYDVKLVQHLQMDLIDRASTAMDNSDFEEAEKCLHDANKLAAVISLYNKPLENVEVNEVTL